MSAPTSPAATAAPAWLSAEMPPGYQTRVAEIQRLSEELHAMERFGRLLWHVGAPLNDAVHDLFAALKFEAEVAPGPAPRSVLVKLDAKRRLLLHASVAEDALQKKSPDLAQVFHLLHETAEAGDRVVLVVNTDPITPPAERPESVTADALAFLRRMGANVVTSVGLFQLWTLSLQDPVRARTYVDRLHEQDGGAFQFPRT